VPRRIAQPEDHWRDASREQVADLRAWVLQRMPERHADGITSWILGLDDEAAEPPKRHLAWYRSVLTDVRAWVLQRIPKRHAHGNTTSVLGSDDDEAAEPPPRYLGLYRSMLVDYGEPRPTRDTIDDTAGAGLNANDTEASEGPNPAESPRGTTDPSRLNS
jgi:hypothetical protein